MESICLIRECDRNVYGRGACRKHYDQHRRGSLPISLPPARRHLPRINKFFEQVNLDGPVPAYRPDLGPCWIWEGGQNGRGYGQFEAKPAHRFLYELFGGVIPEWAVIDHLCCVKTCVNPYHIEPVTVGENTRRYILYKKWLSTGCHNM